MRTVIHGDDFTTLGSTESLGWMREKMMEKFEVKLRGRLGPEEKDEKSIRILNRVVEWTAKGIRYEADQRHAEIIINELGIKEESKSLVNPATPSTVATPEEEEELGTEQATMYRALTARGIYLAQDRTDVQYAVKELSRKMATPTKGSWEKLKRLGRYLKGRERVILEYDYQKNTNCINVWTDTDFAGCKVTRKSTYGGIIQLGGHLIKSWSST